MYEMLLGQSPFRGDDEDEIFDAILEDEPLYPITMPRDAVSILQKVSIEPWKGKSIDEWILTQVMCIAANARSNSTPWIREE